ncbi:polyketide synthase protein [Rutstroemia sp. NJR-2017a BBW]|nr:polyketide synthase protein [Rutstroemia sp. NJR-2017a BBW]
MNMLSVSSKCFSFDERANGYARGEGFAVIVLKSLAEAINARDTIRAVIRATGTNQDGRTQLVTQPSGDAQEDLIRETYKKAGLHPSSASYIEAHGTGTPVGDPIEANAIGKVFRELRRPENPLIVFQYILTAHSVGSQSEGWGAVKSNIGHLEGASGLAGLIKTVLILERGIIPPNANFRRQNMAIDAEFLKIKAIWPNDGPRIASVNSFGYGGSNAHVIVEDAYHYLRDHNMEANHLTIRTLPSQADPTESQNQERMLPIPDEHSDSALSLKNTHEGASAEKLLIFSAADEEGINRIAAALEELWGVEVISHPVRTNTAFKPSFTFIFTGQGAQWPRMGVELMERYTVFRHYLEICAIALKESGCPWDLIALQIAYIKLLEDLNITPDTVVGHSSGEIAAAYSIGAISIRYAMQVAYYRGLLATDLEDNSKYPSGAMMAVGLSHINIQPYFDAISTQYGHCALVVACINSQSSITVSGDKIQLTSLESMLRAANIFARKLQVNVAYHSPLMNPIAKRYLDAIGDMKEMTIPSSRKTPPIMVSSVTGDQVKAKDLQLGSYWVRNMLSAVDFLQAMNRLCQVQHNPPHKLDRSHRKILTTNTLIEIGPHSALEGPVREIVGNAKADWIEYHTVLARNKSAIGTLLDTAGRLHCRGYSALNFASLNRPDNSSPPACLADLPEYEFDHSHDYWWETRINYLERLDWIY